MSEVGTPRSIQENQEDYKQQWRLLQELKASIKYMDMNEQPEGDKTDEDNWYVIGQVPLESDSVSISESEGYLGLPATYLASKPGEEKASQLDKAQISKEDKAGELHLYQEQWHDLEELNTSLRTMTWPEESSDLSISGKASSLNPNESDKADKLRPEEFAEPARRQTPTSLPSPESVGQLEFAEPIRRQTPTSLPSPESVGQLEFAEPIRRQMPTSLSSPESVGQLEFAEPIRRQMPTSVPSPESVGQLGFAEPTRRQTPASLPSPETVGQLEFAEPIRRQMPTSLPSPESVGQLEFAEPIRRQMPTSVPSPESVGQLEFAEPIRRQTPTSLPSPESVGQLEFAEPTRRQTPASLPSPESVGQLSTDSKQGSLVAPLTDVDSPESGSLANVQHSSVQPSHVAGRDQSQTFAHRWFPSRPNAVGNDGIGDRFTTPSFPAQQLPDVYLSVATASESPPPPPQRSQPDGSELRQRLVVKTSAVAPAHALPPSQPIANHKAAVPTGKGSAVQSVQQQHTADHAESPVSQLLGPNFKAAQQVLDQLKQDRLLGDASSSGLSDKSVPDASPVGSLSGTMQESSASSGGPYSTARRVDRPRLEDQYRSSDDTTYSHTGVGAEILQEMEQRYGALSTEGTGQRYGALSAEDNGQRYGTLSTEGSGQRYGALSTEGSGQRYGALSAEDSGQRYDALSADDSGQRYGALSTEGSGQRHGALSAEDSRQRYSALSAEDSGQRYGALSREGSGQRYGALSTESTVQRYGALSTEDSGHRYGALSTEDSGLKLDDSGRSSSNVSQVSGPKDNPTSSSNSVDNTRRAPARPHYTSSARASDASSNDTDDLLNYDAAIESDLQYLAEKREQKLTRRSQPGKTRVFEESMRRASNGSTDSAKRSSGVQPKETRAQEDDLTQYHISLGAGVVTPLQDGDAPSYSSGRSTITARSIDASSSRESLKVQDIEGAETDDSPSSTELYQPVLPGAKASRAASYGIYDIRRSSGPGSTNRRRRAMGLDPLSSRKERDAKTNDTVYVSGGSTPVAIDNAKVRSADSRHSTSSTEADRYERTPALSEVSTENAPVGERLQKGAIGQGKRVYERDSVERREDSVSVDSRVYREKGRTDSLSTDGSLASGLSGLRGPSPAGRKLTVSGRTSDSRQRKKDWIPGFTPSTGKSLEDSVASSSGRFSTQQRLRDQLYALKSSSRLERAPNRTPYGYESDTLTSGSDSVASNISKLSQMIFRPLSARSSLSSQSSVYTPMENKRALRGKRVVSSSSEPSSTSGSFNSAFVEPMFSPSVEQQLKLRELLKNLAPAQAVGNRLIPESVSESSTETAESVSIQMSSSKNEKQKKRSQSVKVKVPSAKKDKQRRTVKYSCGKGSRREAVGQCICGLQEKPRTKEPEDYGGRHKDVYTTARPTRDVAVGCYPDQEVTIAKEGRRTEDACTQTDVLTELVQREAESNQPERLLNETEADRRPVLLTSPQKKAASRRHSSAKKDTVSSPAKDRLVASENAPPPPSPTAAKHARTQSTAWFCSVSNEHFSKPDSTRLDKFQVDLGARVQVPQALQKLTLQEAFMTAKPDFVQRSRARVSQVKEAAKSPRKPRHDKENDTAGSRSPVNSGKSSSSTNKVHQNCDHLHHPKPRKMLRNEMYEMNHRLYKNLPEVKARQEQSRRQAFYRTNRLRAQLFNKRIQNRLKLQRS